MKRYVALSLLMFLVACGAPRIDTSSDERMGKSIARVRDSLPEAKRKEFDQAMVTMSLMNLSSQRTGRMSTQESLAATKARIAGKTADEVIAEASKVRAEAEAKVRKTAKADIEELEKARAAVEAVKGELAKFEVLDAKFRPTPVSVGTEPLIILTVRNNTAHRVSRAYFVGTLTSPGRSVPWLRKEFGYEIRGGIEPGRQATWRLSPDRFSEWGAVKPDNDARLTAEVIALEGADGKRLFTDAEFTDQDAARLASLKKQYGL
jgi:hypothetical protein